MRAAFGSFSSWWVDGCWDHYSPERDGGWPAKGISHQAYRSMILSLYWLHAGVQITTPVKLFSICHSFDSLQCGASPISLGKLRSREAAQAGSRSARLPVSVKHC